MSFASLTADVRNDGKIKKLPFDPTKELLNPHETISKDVMRGLSDFKLVKQTPEGVALAAVRVDVKKRSVTFQIGSASKSAERIPFEKFESEILKPDVAKKLEATAQILGETTATLTEKIRIIIRNAEAYKNEIWNPSARKTEDSKNTPTPGAK